MQTVCPLKVGGRSAGRRQVYTTARMAQSTVLDHEQTGGGCRHFLESPGFRVALHSKNTGAEANSAKPRSPRLVTSGREVVCGTGLGGATKSSLRAFWCTSSNSPCSWHVIHCTLMGSFLSLPTTMSATSSSSGRYISAERVASTCIAQQDNDFA